MGVSSFEPYERFIYAYLFAAREFLRMSKNFWMFSSIAIDISPFISVC